ncbi:PLP-dependent aminotransferase family protein [Elizabethkingia ursingii]|uniref:GntR family transcriptional regulator n=1 Tax=Elizabethkingia ursingii TaxID=1756150 RepID=A0AAJ3NCE8_9FLAO|nr:PLP-dependent aminotransferase family protein [Elizabethkingia ursingii]AQX09620.1 GntR family transcriptional regulator [Elizabethkingia ursingii]KUY30754.1 GntR family transcriptional regulator [Elizabethkingia ursingii]OPB75352.1 GntR family transcriptional regulator [Elizabethkingia ursingii]OPB92957.1 GntR family transcriptional regulator [Elizabethkingia ursingii]
MSSPDQFLYKKIIYIDKKSSRPVYLQIVHQMINAIQRGYLMKGMKLLGTRNMSIILEVHRKTVIAAYEELDAQGWVETIPNKGTFVIESGSTKNINIKTPKRQDLATYPQQTGFSFRQSNLLDNPFEHSSCTYIFNDGVPDTRLSQIGNYSSFYSANLKRKSSYKKIGYYNTEGSEYFKEHLAQYLNLSRGLHISKNNLLITRSTEMSIYIISEILLSEGDMVVVGDPSYFAVNMIFQKSGAVIKTIPVDEEGIRTDLIEELCKTTKIRMLYLTPHHHYPTTVPLSAQRRIELLSLASQYGFAIVEDDYDFEFHYDNTAILPMASSDTDGMVIYVGSFGKSLAPGFRTGFIVAPENLMTEMRKYLGIIDRQGDIIMEQALGEMIAEGEINRHLKKSAKIYKERRDLFAGLLQEHLGDHIKFSIPSGGLAVWMEWRSPINLFQLSAHCQQNDLFIPRTLLYQNKDFTALRLGYGHLEEDEMNKSLQILRNANESLKK